MSETRPPSKPFRESHLKGALPGQGLLFEPPAKEAKVPPPWEQLARRPRCPKCADLGLEPDLVAAGCDTWACGRGHGVL